MKSKTKLMLGDNIESLKKLPDNSIDSVVTDPPYALNFMQKKWDAEVPSVEFWEQVYRVLKPGGHVLSFGGTRTYHRMVVNIEDAGFEIRDQIMWLYGSGFPKSHNIGKAVDKIQGNERQVVGERDLLGPAIHEGGTRPQGKSTIELTKGQSEYEGWGTALKPANEPICVARKPLSEKSVALNVLKWGTGGINIDGCRVGSDEIKRGNASVENDEGRYNWNNGKSKVNEDYTPDDTPGRFPANIIFECICDEVIKGEKGEIKKSGFRVGGKSENSVGLNGVKNAPDNYNDKGDTHTNPMCPCRLLDEQSGVSESKKGKPRITKNFNQNAKIGGGECNVEYNDKGGASRFFYNAKVSKKERNMGLDGFEVEILTPTIKLLLKTDYNNKNLLWEKEDLKTTPVDTDKLHQKDIEEYGVQLNGDKKWSTELFGNIITDQFLMDIKSIIETKTNSTTIYQTLNSLIQKNIKKNIQELLGEMVSDINFVENVEKKNTKVIITYQKKDGLNQNVNLVSLEEVWSINVKENKCGHPTLKPVSLMTYLCRLVTPENGIILDPFMGSGSTGISALLEGFRFVGMEMDPEYMKIATARIENFESYREFIKK